MTTATRDLGGRVTAGAVALVGAATLVAGLAAGFHVAAGVAGGGAVALLNFRWLARAAVRAARPAAGTPPGPVGLGLGVVRHLASFLALAALIGSGWVHPVGVAVGLALLPPVLVVEGLREGMAD